MLKGDGVVQVLLGGTMVYTATNITATKGYTQYSATYTPKSSTVTLTVLGRNDPGHLRLDDLLLCECGLCLLLLPFTSGVL